MGFVLLSGAVTAEPARVAAPTVPTLAVAMTGYNAVPEQTDDTPFETASGAYANPEVVAARSQDMRSELPFGTIIEVTGATREESCGFTVARPYIGYRVIADTMNVRFTKRIDILFDTKDTYRHPDGSIENIGNALGVCHDVSIRVVGKVPVGKMPTTQAELVKLVGKTIELAHK
jgi:3D (Asp-Asp-Asp) domain-containing protein